MSHWNYRVVRRKRTDPDGKVFEGFAIHEAYYDDAGRVWAITENGSEPYGETLEEMREDFDGMAAALDAPALDYDAVPEPGAENPRDKAYEEMR